MRIGPDRPSFAACAQECRALRFLQSQRGGAPCVAALRDGFGLVGHQCLVLERLQPSLLGLIAESAELGRRDALRQLRAVAFQLLVGASDHTPGSCSQRASAILEHPATCDLHITTWLRYYQGPLQVRPCSLRPHLSAGRQRQYHSIRLALLANSVMWRQAKHNNTLCCLCSN